ncbi:MAG: type II toxin-antitoxin system HicA family toxin [Lachnospiraceae bacterium]|jgi:mRNA interferase HicA|nr:type II toxin-antitoxin system HicA family toxin [Lachnospiraceae bacterium]
MLSNEERRKTVAKVSEIIKKIKKNGCYKIREGSNHEIWYCPVTREEFPVPRHYAKELPPGTANSILRKAGLK